MSSVKVVDRRESKCEITWEAHNFKLRIYDLVYRNFGIKNLEFIVRKKYAYGLEKEESLNKYKMMLHRDKERVLYLSDCLLEEARLIYKSGSKTVYDYDEKIKHIYKTRDYVNLILSKLQAITDYFLVDLNKMRPYIDDIEKMLNVLEHAEKEAKRKRKMLHKQGMV